MVTCQKNIFYYSNNSTIF